MSDVAPAGTEHLLLGIVMEDNQTSNEILTLLGVTLDELTYLIHKVRLDLNN